MVELQYFLVEVCCHKMWRLHLKLIKFSIICKDVNGFCLFNINICLSSTVSLV